jgi:hypothetical protein
MKKAPNTPAFEFVLEQLYSADPITKPMFGCHAVYVGNKIVLILRRKEVNKTDNGVWIATTHEHHNSLKMDFPSMRSIAVFGTESGWQNLPEDAHDFEEAAIKVCSLILKGDQRIGKVPKPRKKKED